MPSEALIDVTRVSKCFERGVRVLDDVTFSVPRGAMVALIGASGSGKSTLIRALAGLVAVEKVPDRNTQDGSGSIVLFGRPIQRDGRIVRRRQGIAGAGRRDLPAIQPGAAAVGAHQCLPRPARPHAVRARHAGPFQHGREAARHARARRASASPSTRSSAAPSFPAVSSSAPRSHARWCRAPSSLIADEPIASLDPGSARRVMDILADMNRRDGITVLVSLHQVEYALSYCPRTIALQAGKIVYDGPSDALTPELLCGIYGAEVSELFAHGFEPAGAVVQPPRKRLRRNARRCPANRPMDCEPFRSAGTCVNQPPDGLGCGRVSSGQTIDNHQWRISHDASCPDMRGGCRGDRRFGLDRRRAGTGGDQFRRHLDRGVGQSEEELGAVSGGDVEGDRTTR